MQSYLNVSLDSMITNDNKSLTYEGSNPQAVITNPIKIKYVITSSGTLNIKLVDSKGNTWEPERQGQTYTFNILNYNPGIISYKLDVSNGQQTYTETINISWVSNPDQINRVVTTESTDTINITNTNPIKNDDGSYSTIIKTEITTNAYRGIIFVMVQNNNVPLITESFTAANLPYNHTFNFPIKSTSSGLINYHIMLSKFYQNNETPYYSKLYTIPIYYSTKGAGSTSVEISNSGTSSTEGGEGTNDGTYNISFLYKTVFIIAGIIAACILLYIIIKNKKSTNK